MKKANWWIGLLGLLGAAASWGADNLYMVVDMSGGLEAATWPVSYLSGVPSGGWDYDHKTSKLVLRRIEKGTFTMGSPRGEFGRADDETQHKVTLTKDYYIGVFEFTQQQWMFAMSENPSEYSATAAPVENVNYTRIRGGELGAEWPAGNDVDADSFLAVMRAKTGLAFDLPTEAQWEYACRAGTTTALNSGKNLTSEVACPNMDEVGRYYYNQYDGKGGYSAHTTVGNYAVNNWGLYDMHGNIEEWCLDWWGAYDSASVTNPVGPDSCDYDWRVYRGGCWNDDAEDCRSARRDGMAPNQYMDFGRKPGLYIGFRLACAAPSTQKQTVTFDTHGGICPTATKTYAIATTYGSLPTASRKGYSFNGWFTDGDGGHAVTVYSIVTDESTRTLHAQWTPGEQVVTFNANGGECWTDSRGYTIGTQYGEFPSVKRDGYAFNGWFTTPSGGTLVTTEGTVTTDSTRTLFAQWTPGEQVVRFNPVGGTCDVETATYTVGSAFGTLPTPIREGYVFAGWFWTEDDFSDECWYGGEVMASTIVSAYSTNSRMTLLASWTPGMQTVTFNPNGGQCETEEGRYTVEGSYGTLPVATRNGGVFVGWFTEADGGEQVTEESTVPASWVRTLYAHWIVFPHVCFDANGGSGSMDDFYYEEPEDTISLPLNTFVRPGFRFVGWATRPGGAPMLQDGADVKEGTVRNTTLYAVWLPEEGPYLDFCMGATARECLLWFYGKAGVKYLLQRTQKLSGQEWETVEHVMCTATGAIVLTNNAPADWKTSFWRLVEGSLYLVVDLSGGPDAQRWPVEFLGEIPMGGFNTDEYKTTKLVLRRIEAGTFTMGSPKGELGRAGDEIQHKVTLTQPFYIGVFEVTQKQWELVMGNNPSYYKGETRPVERVSYDMIRGRSAGAEWPRSSEVDAESFMGKLREKTAIGDSMVWDLPTEAQWEYACRAGTTTALNSGKDLTGTRQCANMAEVGRYGFNGDGIGGYRQHTKVGSYLPNAWGLYDMHGNVWEWCLDWYGTYATGAVTDPEGAASGSDRVRRGGGWGSGAQYCRSAYRSNDGYPSGAYNYLGFRLARILPIGYSQENTGKENAR